MYKKFREFVALREDASNMAMNMKMPATPQQKSKVGAELDLLKAAPPMPGSKQGTNMQLINRAKQLNTTIPAVKTAAMATSLAQAQSGEMQ